MADIDIVDAFGRVRIDFTEAEIASLSPDHRERLEALFIASAGERNADQELADSITDVSTRVRELSDAEAALTAARPRWTFLDEHRRVVRAHSALPLDPAEVRAEKKNAAELQKRLAPLVNAVEIATSALQNARLRVNAARDGLRTARTKIAAALVVWQSGHKPVTHESLVREAAARSQERLQGLADGTIDPPAPPKHASKLDALMTSGARGKSTRRLPSQR